MAAGQTTTSAPATAQTRSATRPAAVSDDPVVAAVRRGVYWLYSRQSADGSFPSRHSRQHPGGAEGLAVLAALAAGDDANRPDVRKAVDFLHRVDPQTVYARSVRATAYARLAAQTGGGPAGAEAQKRLAEDIAWLVKAMDRAGGWGYGAGHPTTAQTPDWVDTCNSLMATMALDEAARAGAAVPATAWVKVRSFWANSQNEDGGWGYEAGKARGLRLRGSSYGTLTAGGGASLLSALRHDAPALETTPGMLFAPTRPADGADLRAIDKGLQWLGTNFVAGRVPKWVWGGGEDWLLFYHWHLARAANLAGLRTLSGQEWRPALAAAALALQRPDGSWSAAQDSGKDDSRDPVARTAMAILALAEAHRPVAISKLALAGPWEGAYLDAANLADWLSETQGAVAPSGWHGSAGALRALAWQLMDANADARALAEAPLLYLEVPPRLGISLDLAARIQAFLRGGGTLVVQSIPKDRVFAEQLERYFRGTFKGLRSDALKADHPVFGARYPVPAVEGFALGDALRTRIFLFVGDLSGPAQRGPDKETLSAFRTWANLLEYATDGAPLAASRAVQANAAGPRPIPATVRTIAVARLRHKGDRDLCPGAMKRLGDVLASAVSADVEDQSVDASGAASCQAPLLWLVGAAALEFTPQEVARLKEYLQAGGTLFVDSAAGNGEFLASARRLAKDLAGRDAEELSADHPLLTGALAGGAGADVSTVAYSRALAKKIGSPRGRPGLLGASVGGRLAILVSPYSVTCPLEGLPTYGIEGLSVLDARRLAANVVLHSAFRPRADAE